MSVQYHENDWNITGIDVVTPLCNKVVSMLFAKNHYAVDVVNINERYCENILREYLYDGDFVSVILKGISIFKFPKRFLEISSRDLTSSFLLQLI